VERRKSFKKNKPSHGSKSFQNANTHLSLGTFAHAILMREKINQVMGARWMLHANVCNRKGMVISKREPVAKTETPSETEQN
jgi:hypothetical protein